MLFYVSCFTRVKPPVTCNKQYYCTRVPGEDQAFQQFHECVCINILFDSSLHRNAIVCPFYIKFVFRIYSRLWKYAMLVQGVPIILERRICLCPLFHTYYPLCVSLDVYDLNGHLIREEYIDPYKLFFNFKKFFVPLLILFSNIKLRILDRV